MLARERIQLRSPGHRPILVHDFADDRRRRHAGDRSEIEALLQAAGFAVNQLDEHVIAATLGTVLKYREDQERVQAKGFGGLISATRACDD